MYKQVLPGLLGPEAPPALVALLLLDLLHMGRSKGVTRFKLVDRAAIRFGALAGVGSVAFLRRRVSNLRVFVPVRDHTWASFHFSSLIRRARWAREVGRGIGLRPYLSLFRSHSTPCPSGSSAASFAHASALSLPWMDT